VCNLERRGREKKGREDKKGEVTFLGYYFIYKVETAQVGSGICSKSEFPQTVGEIMIYDSLSSGLFKEL